MNDHDWVDVPLQLWKCPSKDFTCKNDDRRCTVAHFLILCSAELDHGFSRRMSNLDFSQNSVTVVGEHNSAHWIEQHLEHGFGAKT